MANKKILLGLTTTLDSDWRGKIKEIDKLNLKEIALFPTFLKPAERRELYELLEKTGLESIPHVHLRGEDMPTSELDYFVEKYHTKVFNIHSPREFPVNYDYSKYKQILYLENTGFIPNENEINSLGNGLCVDFSHWSGAKKANQPIYEGFEKMVEKFTIGCGHISAVLDKLTYYPNGWASYDSHTFKSLSEFDYIKNYLKYIPDTISIELENSFEEQLKVKEYLEKIII
jgi:hypothetical protein